MKLLITFLILFLQSCTSTDKTDQKEDLSSLSQNQANENMSREEVEIFNRRHRRADQFAMDGLYREAIQEYQWILRRDRNNLHAQKMLGIISVKTGEYAKAIKHLQYVVNTDNLDFEANYYLAEAYRTQDRYGDAIFRYKVALSIKPNHILSLKALAWSYYKIRYYKEALKISQKLKKISPEDTQLIIITARILNKMGLHKKSLSKIRNAITSAPKEQIPYLESVLGDIYFNLGDIKKASLAYKSALKEQPLLAGALLGLAKITLENGSRPDLAITYLERASRIKPSLLETYYHLGIAQLKTNPAASRRYLARFNKEASGDPEYTDQLKKARKILSDYKKRPLNSELESLDSQL